MNHFIRNFINYNSLYLQVIHHSLFIIHYTSYIIHHSSFISYTTLCKGVFFIYITLSTKDWKHRIVYFLYLLAIYDQKTICRDFFRDTRVLNSVSLFSLYRQSKRSMGLDTGIPSLYGYFFCFFGGDIYAPMRQ
jgi:hypothetical protein